MILSHLHLFKRKIMDKKSITIICCFSIFIATTFGASLVFFIKNDINKQLNSIICGFSAGVMIAASVFSLILPSIDDASYLGALDFLPASLGVFIGALFLLIVDLFIFLLNRHKSKKLSPEKDKLTKFITAFVMHNIPEGLAVGFAFGSALALDQALAGAIGLTIGIAIQNIPEGLAVALPTYKFTKNKGKSFVFGMLSGAVEPIFAFFGVIVASKIQSLLPWLMAFSAGAMLFVTVEDLIPDAKYSEKSHVGTYSFIFGFVIMMILDVLL